MPEPKRDPRIWVIEILTDDGWRAMGHGEPDGEHSYMLHGAAAAYKSRKEAQTVSNIISWGRNRHRIQPYVAQE